MPHLALARRCAVLALLALIGWVALPIFAQGPGGLPLGGTFKCTGTVPAGGSAATTGTLTFPPGGGVGEITEILTKTGLPLGTTATVVGLPPGSEVYFIFDPPLPPGTGPIEITGRCANGGVYNPGSITF